MPVNVTTGVSTPARDWEVDAEAGVTFSAARWNEQDEDFSAQLTTFFQRVLGIEEIQGLLGDPGDALSNPTYEDFVRLTGATSKILMHRNGAGDYVKSINSGDGSGHALTLRVNNYMDGGTPRYTQDGAATAIEMGFAELRFRTAASGVKDAEITWGRTFVINTATFELDGNDIAIQSGAGSNDLDDYHTVTAFNSWVSTALTTLGLATGNSPQFAGINLGHASDTTLARQSAGNVSVEGNLLYRAGGTDVPIADGGTGSSTAAGARTNLSVYSQAEANAAFVDITGDTMTGPLTVTTDTGFTMVSRHTTNDLTRRGGLQFERGTGAGTVMRVRTVGDGVNGVERLAIERDDFAEIIGFRQDRSVEFFGNVVLASDPTADMHPVTLQYLNANRSDVAAFCTFNGSAGTITAFGPLNVSSITDLGVGRYRVNFAEAMPDINFSAVASCNYTIATGAISVVAHIDARATGYVDVHCRYGDTYADPTYVSLIVAR